MLYLGEDFNVLRLQNQPTQLHPRDHFAGRPPPLGGELIDKNENVDVKGARRLRRAVHLLEKLPGNASLDSHS